MVLGANPNPPLPSWVTSGKSLILWIFSCLFPSGEPALSVAQCLQLSALRRGSHVLLQTQLLPEVSFYIAEPCLIDCGGGAGPEPQDRSHVREAGSDVSSAPVNCPSFFSSLGKEWGWSLTWDQETCTRAPSTTLQEGCLWKRRVLRPHRALCHNVLFQRTPFTSCCGAGRRGWARPLRPQLAALGPLCFLPPPLYPSLP